MYRQQFYRLVKKSKQKIGASEAGAAGNSLNISCERIHAEEEKKVNLAIFIIWDGPYRKIAKISIYKDGEKNL